MTPEEAYKHGYEDGLKAGREAAFFEVEPDEDLDDLKNYLKKRRKEESQEIR